MQGGKPMAASAGRLRAEAEGTRSVQKRRRKRRAIGIAKCMKEYCKGEEGGGEWQ